MAEKKTPIEERVVFSLGMAADGVPAVVIGIPESAWEYMRDGKTHNIDFTRVGVDLRLMLYGGKDHAACMKVIEEHNAAQGRAALDLRREDFSTRLKEPSPEDRARAAAKRRGE